MSGIFQTLLGSLAGVLKDAYYKYVTLLLTGNSPGGTVAPYNADASTNKFNLTQNGDVRNATFSPFNEGYYGVSVGTGSYISAASNAAFGMGTGDFTVECWVYPTAAWAGAGSYNAIVFVSGTGIYFGQNASGFGLRQSGTANIISYGTSPTLNTWTHVAVVRSGTTCTLYYNGTSVATATSSANFSAGTLQVGSDGTYAFTGYLSNVRLVKGTAVYTGNFTPSTTPLTAISGTSLLTCQSNRFIDNSANAFTITATGSPAISSAQPFTLPTANVAYGASYFDGSGDYLSIPTNSALDIWVGDFTVECWAWLNGNQSSNVGLVNKAPNNASASWTPGWCFSIVSNALTVNTPNDVKLFTTGVTIPTYSWVHCVLVKSGSTVSIFQNGTRTGTITNSTSYSNTTDAVTIGTDRNLAGPQFNGYISNVRLVKGTAIYDPTQSTLTVPTTPLTAVANTSLLTLQSSYPAWNNGFLDGSTNNFLITRNGNTTQGTFTPYGANWSNYFNNESANNSYLSVASNAAFAYGTGDFTAECWVYLTATPTADAGIIEQRPASTNGSYLLIGVNSSKQLFVYVNTAYRIGPSVSTAVSANTWNHVAYSRSSGTATLYLNGSSIGSWSDSTTYGNQPVGIGYQAFTPSNVYFPGYISNLRIVKGTAVYTSAFTPSTAPLTAISGTSLLTCQSNRFVDNSSNAFALTVTGTPSVQRFSPFSPSSAYSTSTIGGSGYFDRAGDYLTVPNNAAFSFGSSNFTIECWVYPTTATNLGVLSKRTTTIAYEWVNLGFSASVVPAAYITFDGATWGVSLSSSVACNLNEWSHLAVVRNGTAWTLYVNGVSRATQTASGSVFVSTTAVAVGASAVDGSFPFGGYIGDTRIVNGTAVYTAAFTPPTAPLTAVTNTSLLLLTTNAGVFDNAMMNNLETAGKPQITTTQSKFGGSSIYFDNTSNCYLAIPCPAGSGFDIGSGDYTIECFAYFLGWNSVNTIFGTGAATNYFGPRSSGTTLEFRDGSAGGTQFNFSCSLSLNTWTHIALSRSGTSLRCFVNGTQVGSTQTTSAPPFSTSNSPLRIGAYYNGTFNVNGYIDDFRVTKGYARYTANFTAPTEAFPTS